MIGVFDGVSKRENSEITKQQIAHFNQQYRQLSSDHRASALKAIMYTLPLKTDERCWFQYRFATYFDQQYQCDGSADPTINALAKQHKDAGRTVAVLSIDSDLHTTALANIDTFIWLPTSFFSPTFYFTTQQQLIQHYRHVFRVANRNIDIPRLLLRTRLLAGAYE